jgi:hypothetical protein
MPRNVAYFDNQGAAAAVLKLDVYELREAKAAGCPAFRSGRIYRDELLPWLVKWRRQRAGQATSKSTVGMIDHDLGQQAREDNELPRSHWDRKKARLDYERALYKFEIEKEKHLPTDEITVAVGQMLVGFRTALNMLPANAARWLIGLRDFHQIKDKLQSEVGAVLNSLNRCDYLEKEPEEVITKSLPFDAETEALLGKIALPGQDRGELYKLIGHVAARAITEFGRLTLSDLLQRQLPSSFDH